MIARKDYGFVLLAVCMFLITIQGALAFQVEEFYEGECEEVTLQAGTVYGMSLLAPLQSTFNNITINVSNLQDITESYEPDFYANETIGVLNNAHNSNDNNNITYARTGAVLQTNFTMNFSTPNISSGVLQFKSRVWKNNLENFSSIQCKNTDTGYHGMLLDFRYKYAEYTNDTEIQLPAGCIKDVIEILVIDNSTNVSNGYLDIYETAIKHNITAYPNNLTLHLNQTYEVYNNNSDFNESDIISIDTSYPNEYYLTDTNLSFYWSNTKNNAKIRVCLLMANYTTNHTIQVYDELTNTLLTTTNITVNRIVDEANWDTYWTTTGLISTTNMNYTGIVDLEYYDTAGYYATRHYYYYNTNDTNNQTLYVIPKINVTTVLFTLYRESGEVLPDYYIEVYKRWKDTNEYLLVETHKTDFNGQALLNSILVDETYKYVIRDNTYGVLYSSSPTSLTSTSIGLTVQLTEDIWTSLDLVDDINIGIPTYNNDTKQVMTYYEDTNNIIEYFQMIVTRRTAYQDEILCDNISYESSNTLYCTINPNKTGYHIAELYVETNTNNSYYGLGGYTFGETDPDSQAGKPGVWATALLVIMMAGLALFSPVLAIIMAIIALIVSLFFKFLILGIGTTVVILIIGGMLVFKMRR